MLCIQNIRGPIQKSRANKFWSSKSMNRKTAHQSILCTASLINKILSWQMHFCHCIRSLKITLWLQNSFANKDGQLVGVSHWLHNVASYITFYKPEQMVVWCAYAHTIQWMGRSSQPFFWILTKHTDKQCGPMCCHAAGLFFSFLDISHSAQWRF
jgi:hypothetical protein